MALTTAIAIYFLIWWLTLFAVLPWGVRAQGEEGSTPGSDPGAPVVARMALRLLWTTGISGAIFAVIFVVHIYGLVTLDDLAALMGLPQ